MNPTAGLTLGAIVGMGVCSLIFAAGGWWLLLTPVGFVAMVLAIAVGSRL